MYMGILTASPVFFFNSILKKPVLYSLLSLNIVTLPSGFVDEKQMLPVDKHWEGLWGR